MTVVSFQGPSGPPGRLVRIELGLVLFHFPLLPLLAPPCVPVFLPLPSLMLLPDIFIDLAAPQGLICPKQPPSPC